MHCNKFKCGNVSAIEPRKKGKKGGGEEIHARKIDAPATKTAELANVRWSAVTSSARTNWAPCVVPVGREAKFATTTSSDIDVSLEPIERTVCPLSREMISICSWR